MALRQGEWYGWMGLVFLEQLGASVVFHGEWEGNLHYPVPDFVRDLLHGVKHISDILNVFKPYTVYTC